MRVKYHGLHDLSIGAFLGDAARIADNFSSKKHIYRLNDILELHNVSFFLDHPALKDRISSHGVTYQELKPIIRGAISRYFKEFTSQNISRRAVEIDYEYISDFFGLFIKAHLPKIISQRQMRNLLARNSVPLRSLMQWKELVRQYQDMTKDLLLQNPANAEILLDHYFADRLGNASTLSMPSTLTSTDKNYLLESYVESASSNLNYLRLMLESRDSDGLRISNELRLKARRKIEAETEAFFEEEQGLRIRYSVALEESQQELRVEKFEDNEYSVSISKDWLTGHLEYPAVVNSFLFLFDFADQYMMLKLPSFSSERTALEQLIGVPSKSAYQMGPTFRAKDIVSLFEMNLYRDLLLEQDVRLEDVIEWFFTTYLPTEFQTPPIHIQMPSSNSNYTEKCSQAFPEMESSLKQYHYLIRDGEIDQELVRLSTWHVDYRTLPSMLPQKYAYPATKNDTISRLLYMLFSDQAGLGYIREDLRGDTLFDLLNESTVTIGDFHNYQLPYIAWLRKQRILRVEGRRLTFVSVPKIETLLLFHHYGAVNIGRVPTEIQRWLASLHRSGQIEIESTLLSRAEADYFDYYLNMRKFGNGLNLKNMYSHGTRPIGSDQETDVHLKHYLIGLRLFVSIMIKINDELDQKAPLKWRR